MKVLLYFRESSYNISDYFNPDKISEFPDLRDIEYLININRLIPYSPLYNLSEVQLKVLYLYLQDIIRKYWIRPSISPIIIPILFILKKDKGLRFYINYYRLNKVIIKNRYPFPLINKTLNRLVKAKIFTKLNLKDIYYYIYIYNNYK